MSDKLRLVTSSNENAKGQTTVELRQVRQEKEEGKRGAAKLVPVHGISISWNGLTSPPTQGLLIKACQKVAKELGWENSLFDDMTVVESTDSNE